MGENYHSMFFSCQISACPQIFQISACPQIFPPRIGREVPESEYDPDIRELIFHSYRIIYQINPEHILIVAVIHGSRDLINVEIKPWDIV